MAHMPPPPAPRTLSHPIRTFAPSQNDADSNSSSESDCESDSDSGSESDSDIPTPSALSPSRPSRITSDPSEGISERLLSQLRSSIEGYPSFANYCCGGNIPIASPSRNSRSPQDPSKTPTTASPITLRFDTISGNISKLSFPPELEDEKGKGKRKVEIEDLLGSCTPDISGDDKSSRGTRVRGRRSSAKLGREKFSVDVHPSELGILDAVKQILLPRPGSPSSNENSPLGGKSNWDGGGNESWKERKEHCGVRAELCELGVYFSSSSNTQTPFDTLPKWGSHFGTLVICLPYGHQGGGQLVTHKDPVSNKTHSTLFPTSSINPTITWAAFPRSTSHSILPITCGHLVTLTYNLYTTEAIGGIMQRYPVADPRLSPLFKIGKGMLENPDFLPEGGILAHYCAHRYSHTSKSTQNLMPYSLLGIDATIFCVFRTLGLHTCVGPTLGDEAWDEWQQIKEERLFSKIYRDSDEDMDVEEREDEDEDEDEEDDEEEGEVMRLGLKWHRLKMINGNGGATGSSSGKGASKATQKSARDGIFRVGVDPSSFIDKHYPAHLLRNVIYLNESSDHGWEIAMANIKLNANPSHGSTGKMADQKQRKSGGDEEDDDDEEEEEEETGNGKREMELMWQYSHAVILIEVPAMGQKGRSRGSPVLNI